MPRPTRILIIGDSISIGYTPFVSEMLSGRAEVGHNDGNGGDARNVRAHLDEWLAEFRAQIVHLNCGLHDIKVPFDSDARQVPLAEYRRHLTWVADRLKASPVTAIWASSTPVVEAWHHQRKEFDRFNADVDAYNAAAAEIMTAAGIAVNDLHSIVAAAGPEKLLSPDGVHFPDPGYRMLAEKVAACLRAVMNSD
ncbi:MAG TPA: SGNH/GDSL hydrolase family protein [Phycisphaerae bacterium]|nr:SGNH/GDSL hydrolase family protein [Phycisphaerae bacterium]